MQYKLAMERILNKGNIPSSSDVKSDLSHKDIELSKNSLRDVEGNVKSKSDEHLAPSMLPVWAEIMRQNTQYILNFLIPLGWCFLFVLIMTRESVISTLYMPFLGIFAATLANTVPIGGGIVYVPALLLLGVDMKLGVSFTVATMSFGNGLFGFLRWMNKNATLLIWESFLYTVIPSWIGSIIAIFFLPEMSTEYVKMLFAAVCIKVSILVALAAWKGGMDKLTSIFTSTTSQSTAESLTSTTPLSSSCILTLIVITFLGGVVLVPNIGIGPALTTYMILNYFGYSTHSSIVTGIITGGWVCLLPFVIHIFYQQDVPYELWLMVIPGVYLGAAVSYFPSSPPDLQYSSFSSVLHMYMNISV